MHDGWKIIYTVGLALLKLLSAELLAADFTGVMTVLGQDMKSSFFDANKIIKTAKVSLIFSQQAFNLKTKKIQKIEASYREPTTEADTSGDFIFVPNNANPSFIKVNAPNTRHRAGAKTQNLPNQSLLNKPKPRPQLSQSLRRRLHQRLPLRNPPSRSSPARA